jgi:hypothetical protein
LAKARKVTNEAEARRALAAAKAARRPPREWAREHGIDARSLNLWRVNLERRDARRASRRSVRALGQPQLVELVPTRSVEAAATMTTSPSASNSGGPVYVLEVAGARVTFGDDVTTATLRRVVEVLRSC